MGGVEEGKLVAVIDRLASWDKNQGGWCQAHSGSTSKGLIALSCWPLVFSCWKTMADRHNRALCLRGSAIRENGKIFETVQDIETLKKRERGEEGWKDNPMMSGGKKSSKERNLPGSAVIFTYDFWQQSSIDSAFYCLSGSILLCMLNIQVFGFVSIPRKRGRAKKSPI